MWAEHSICISADDQLGQLKRHQSKLAGPIGVGLDTLKGVLFLVGPQELLDDGIDRLRQYASFLERGPSQN
jgi:hypothetical protein